MRGQSYRSVDLLGRVYQYFLTRFTSAEIAAHGYVLTANSIALDAYWHSGKIILIRQQEAVNPVLMQAELLCADWAAA